MNYQAIEWLEKSKIESMISPENRVHLSGLEIMETIDSTNTYLLSRAKQHAESGLICLAEEQTQGRGRQGKQWISPKGTNIYCSLLWHFSAKQVDISHLSLAVAVMTMRALKHFTADTKLQLKWPNDIYFSERKLAGILIEGLPVQDNIFPVVIGIGLNLQLPAAHPIATTSIGVEEIIGEKVSRNQLAGLVINELLSALPHYMQKGFSPFLLDWNKHDMLRNKFVVIRAAQHELAGIAQGVNEKGELSIRDERGVIQSFRCGEVSVRLQRV